MDVELETEIINILEREKHLVLATCSDGRVTARTMSHVNDGMDILFQTDKRFLKVEQMLKNPKVALCIGNLQIEGTAELLRHPSEPENADFCSIYRQKHPHSFEMYAYIKDEIVVKVKPSLITLWKYINGKPCRDYLDVLRAKAYRVFYEVV
jgi:nitroimidazol reductase NimA-like FMN-containing flavoprotein (pyridoxamine 5'-phosphate oxidase superfamily)